MCALSPRGSYVPRLGLYSSTRTAHMRVCVCEPMKGKGENLKTQQTELNPCLV